MHSPALNLEASTGILDICIIKLKLVGTVGPTVVMLESTDREDGETLTHTCGITRSILSRDRR